MNVVTHRTFSRGQVIDREVKNDNIHFTVRFDSGKVPRFSLDSFESGLVSAASLQRVCKSLKYFFSKQKGRVK